MNMGDAVATKREIRKSGDFAHVETFGKVPKKALAEVSAGESPCVEKFARAELEAKGLPNV